MGSNHCAVIEPDMLIVTQPVSMLGKQNVGLEMHCSIFSYVK